MLLPLALASGLAHAQGLEHRVTTLEAQLAALSSTVVALQSELTDAKSEVATLKSANAALQSTASTLQADLAIAKTELAAVQSSSAMALAPYLQVTAGGSPKALLTGINLQIVNGTGSTQAKNGLGNLIIGYDTPRSDGVEFCSAGNGWLCNQHQGEWAVSHKTGSHNLVIGDENNYATFGSMVIGFRNTSIGPGYASVSGGAYNTASAWYASVTGGTENWAGAEHCHLGYCYDEGPGSTVAGGLRNAARGSNSTVTGGTENTAEGVWSAVSGGASNLADGRGASVSGGDSNVAGGTYASVSGGENNRAGYKANKTDPTSSIASSVSGGRANNASANFSSILGGSNNYMGGPGWVLSGAHGTFCGGYDGRIFASYGSVLGGQHVVVTTDYQTVP